MKKKNIVVFTNTLLSGGAEKQALLLAVNLKDQHHTLLVVYYGNKVEEKFRNIINENHIDVIYLMGNHFKKIITFYRILKNHHIDIIFSYLLTTNLVGGLIGKLARVPVRAGGIRNAKLDKNKEPVQRLINNYLSTHTIFNNYDGVNQLKSKGFKITNAIVIPNCFELKTNLMERAEPDLVRIITVGRFVNQKGYFDALKVMSILKEDKQRFKYFIIGFGELEDELRKKIQLLELEDVVEMVINPSNLNEYYIHSDIYLCTSYFEGLSNTIMEALSFSLPIVATNVGDNNRLVTDCENGYLIEPGDCNLFVSPLKKLIASTVLRNNMGRQSFKLIETVYSGGAFKENYEQFINQAS